MALSRLSQTTQTAPAASNSAMAWCWALGNLLRTIALCIDALGRVGGFGALRLGRSRLSGACLAVMTAPRGALRIRASVGTTCLALAFLSGEPQMWQSLILGFFAGVFGANGVPHFVKGITKESYPCVFGNSPVPNLIAGWLSFIVAGLFAGFVDRQHYALPSLFAGAIGALVIGLFHAAIGAFGR
jgi:hypothetical protein